MKKPKLKDIWRERIIFRNGGEGAWADLMRLLTKKKIHHDGHLPIYIKFERWEGDAEDSIKVSNAPIIK